MAIVAVGGYGRGTLAPGSDVDLLFLLPYKQTPWGESVVEFILYMLWDLGLKVGHATRSVDECIRLSRSDMTIRTAMLEARYIWGDKALFDDLVAALRRRGGEGHRARVHRRQARRARRAPPPAGRRRATWSSRTSRTARAACATSTRCSGSPSISTASARARSWSRPASSRAPSCSRFRKSRGFPLGGALPPAFPHRPRRGAPVLRPPARDGRAARLHRASRPEGRRALHEALLPGRQGRRRPDPHLLRRARGAPRQAGAGAQPLLRPRPQAPQRKIPGSTDFVVDNDRINIADDEVFARDPVNLIRIFHLADTLRPRLPSRRAAAGRPARCGLIDAHAPRRPGGQPAVPRDPVVAQRNAELGAARA